MNPARVLIQRILWDFVCDDLAKPHTRYGRGGMAEHASEFLAEPARDNLGWLQSFDVQIACAVADGTDDHESAVADEYSEFDTMESAIADIAAHHYGRAGRDAAMDCMDAMLAHREQTVGERGVW